MIEEVDKPIIENISNEPDTNTENFIDKLPFKRNEGSNPLNLSKYLLYKKKTEVNELIELYPNIPRGVLEVAWDSHYLEHKSIYEEQKET